MEVAAMHGPLIQRQAGREDISLFLSEIYQWKNEAFVGVLEKVKKQLLSVEEALGVLFLDGSRDELLYCFLLFLSSRHKGCLWLVEALRKHIISVDEAQEDIFDYKEKECGKVKEFTKQRILQKHHTPKAA
ncbi:MAG: hypothetical protein NUV49_04035 [Patescibacteria group bacterium]|nr:hypothetical protein [Patescibacteria group bacterium]